MLMLECLKQHVGLIKPLVFLINCISYCSSLVISNDNDSDLTEFKFCDKNCTNTEECCSFYYCNDGMCRKPGSNIAFVVLTKVSLETTFAIILAATFVFLMRGLLNQAFRRHNNNSNVGYSSEYNNVRPAPLEIRQDKPPSYEECVQSSQRGTHDSPPPYIIPVNYSSNLNNRENYANLILDTRALGVVKSVF